MTVKAFGLALVASTLLLSGCDAGNSEQSNEESLPAAGAKKELASDISLALEPAQLDWVGQKIFQNECAGQYQCLVHWNEAEAFPSLGIGQFIVIRKRVNERFVESFPALVEYMEQRQLESPNGCGSWSLLTRLGQIGKLLAVADSPEMAELRGVPGGYLRGSGRVYLSSREKPLC